MNDAVPNLSERLAKALRLIDESIKDASRRLENQPDNPNIRRLCVQPGAFVVQMSEVMRRNNPAGDAGRACYSWATFDHDWLAQYRHARELLERRQFAALRTLLSAGGYRDRSHGYRSFAPEVIANIRRITGDLSAAANITDAKLMTGADADACEAKSGGPIRTGGARQAGWNAELRGDFSRRRRP